jgi:acyl-CoA synthetase (AMP-forming)/AMP-acid ligase II
MLPDNLGYLFDDALRLHPAAPAVLQGDLVLNFGELDDRCNRMSNLLAGLGMEKAERAAILFNNDYRFLECMFGAMRIGAIPVPLNTRMSDEALAYILEDSGAKLLLAGPDMGQRLNGILPRCGRQITVITDGAVETARPYEASLKAADAQLQRRRTPPDEICMLPYTSGSTGRPKGVMLTHHGQVWNTDVIRKAAMLDDSDRALVAVPMCHKNAMLGAVKPFLLAGGSLVILPGFNPRDVILAIERYRVTYLTGVPAMYKMILAERELLAQHDVSSVRYALCGSAEVPEELLQQFRDIFRAPISESYGLTEGGPVPLVNTRWGMKKRGSCGLEIPGCDVRLLRDDGSEASINETGELVTRNPGLAKGYWNQPEVTEEKFRDGWLHTGDLLRRDSDGYYYFVGRKDDVMNVAGEKVHPKEVEDLLLRHANIKDACVVPARHELKGCVPVAFVSEREAGRTTEEELKSFFLTHGAAYAHPRRVFFLESLPLNSTGKLDRQKMRQMAGQYLGERAQ